MTLRTPLGRGIAIALSLALSQIATPVAQAATPHLVDQQAVVARLLDSAGTREAKVQLFREALATPEAQKQARAMGYDPAKLQAAVPHLSDKELADLERRAANVKDVAAGHHGGSDGIVILGVILLLAGIAVLVAVSDNYYDDYNDCYCY